MHDQLREAVRVLAGRGPQPTAAIIDSQSVKAADTVGQDSRGYDAGKKIEGRKRHLAVDVMGLILCVLVTAASATGVGPRRCRSFFVARRMSMPPSCTAGKDQQDRHSLRGGFGIRSSVVERGTGPRPLSSRGDCG